MLLYTTSFLNRDQIFKNYFYHSVFHMTRTVKESQLPKQDGIKFIKIVPEKIKQ